MGKTDAGDEFRVFATVVAMMKKWIKTVGIEHVESFDFGADKTDHASDGRARLYTRFAKQLASKLGWKLEQSTTGNGSTSFFKLVNPKPIPRDDAYWDALDEEVEVSLHGDTKKGYVLSKIEVSGDERNAGQGTKAMQDIVDRMDREGAIIALTPDDAFGGNKNRLIKFYKRFGFVPNKGRNKDFRFRETMIRYPQTSESVNEGYKLQLERDADMMVLNITDTETGKRTEVRGKSGYETNNYDANDKLHQLLDKISKSANISELMNGEVVGINPKHPDGPSAKTATTKAFNEAKDGLPVKTLKGLYHVGTLDASKKRDGYEGAGLSVSTHPDAWKQIARGHVTGDTHSATKEGNKFLDAHGLSDAHNEQIKQWALENDYLAQQETVTVCYYDDEMEDDLCSTFNSMADAEAEYDEELEHMDVSVDKGGIVPTDKLKKETRQNRIDSTGVLEFVLPIFAEQQGLDGVWWQDKLDVQRYSAPRGVIVPSKIKSWKFAVNETAGVGRVVKGVNTTVDVGVDEIIKQVKKFGNDVNRDGIPTKNLKTK
jgi:GNAT superfamily N-acetyltransferase